MGECTPVLSRKKSAAHRKIGMLQITFWLSDEYTRDLRFVRSFAKLGFESHFNISRPGKRASYD